MTIESQIADLVTATTSLLSAVNVAKTTLDQKVDLATTQAALATSNGGVQVALATSQAGTATTQANNASQKAAEASASAASAANQAVAAISSSTAANLALLALGDVLANGIGAITVDGSGDLTVAYNTPTVTSMAINAGGNLNVTYP